MWAQTDWTDVTSVITNPSFETDDAVSDATKNALNSATVTGWTVLPTTSVTNAQAAVVNKSSTLSVLSGSDGATADSKYFYVRQNWNKTGNFGIQQEIAAGQPAGLYLLTCKIMTSSSDPNDTKWYLSIKEGDKDAVTTDKAGSAAKWLNYGVVIYKESASTTLTISAYMVAVKDGNSKHYAMLLDDFQLKYISPSDLGALTANNSLDLTGVIYNEGIYNATKTAMPRGWTAYASTRGNSNFTEGTGDTQLEGWSGTNMNIDYYQRLTNLPKGKYTVTAYAHDSNDKGAKVYGSSDEEKYGDMGTDYADVTTEPFKVLSENINIGIKHNGGATWVTGDNFRVTYLGIKPLYDEALMAATGARDNAEYANITGTEKTELLDAIALTPSTYEEYVEAYNTLTTKTEAFIAADASYNTFDTEKTNALLMGVNENDVVRPTSGSNDDLLTAMRGLYALEDAATTNNYTIDATNIFGEWINQNTGTGSGEHWSGDSRSYIDKNDGSGFTMSVTNTVTLPEGHYVFKAAARAAGVNGAFNMSVKLGNADAVYKHYNAQGNTGKGIDTSGAVNYGEGTFANSNNGRGWEWRLFAFDLNEPTEVKMQVYAQILGGNWVSFSDITLLTTEDNVGICQIMWNNALTAATTAREDDAYSNITGKEKTDLVSAITATETEPNTPAGYQEQESALLDATSAFIAAKDTYDEYVQESVIATDLGVDVPAINPASTTAAMLISNMQTMNVSDYSAATTNYTYDATALLGTWSNAPGLNHGESWDGTTGDGSDEYYDLYNAAAKTMKQTVTLPKAKYVLIAKGRASTDGRLTLSDGTNTITFPHKSSTGKGITTTGVANFGDGTYANSNNGRGWEYRFLTFESDGTTATTLTFSWTTANKNWCGLDDITLLAIPEDVTINEDEDYTPTYTIANVTFNRKTVKDWNGMVLPFDVAEADMTNLKLMLGANGSNRLMDFTGITYDEAKGVTLNFTEATEIKAGRPFMIRLADEGTSYSTKGTKTVFGYEMPYDNPVVLSTNALEDVTKTVEDNDNIKYTFKGTYAASTDLTDVTFALIQGNTFYYHKAGTASSAAAFRAYFVNESTDPDAAGARISFNFGDSEVTGISEVKTSTADSDAIYTLGGQRVMNAQKGLYIQNGKKVIIK